MTARQVHFPDLPPRPGRTALRTELGVTPLAHGAEEIGVVDLGSNSARLAIYAAAPMGPPWIVYESKELPRLAAGIDERGRLTRPAQRGALETLERFQKILDDRGVRRRAAVATGVVRQAVNRSSFLFQVRHRTTLPLRVITGEEEARYAYLGVRSSLTLGDDLVADLGGGTLQLLRIRSGNPVHVVSLPLGALRMHREFLPHDPPKRRELQALRDYVDVTLEDGAGWADPLPTRLVGVGGTFRATGHLLRASRHYPLVRVHGLEVSRRFLLSETARLSELPSEERRNVPGLSADRSDIILAGLVVISRLLRRVGLKRFTVSACGIREGLAQELLGRPAPLSRRDLTLGSAQSMAWGFHLSFGHGGRVREMTLALFDLLRSRHGLGEEERLALEVAALLHDSGTVVSYPEHQKHSSYLVENHPLYGLTHRELLLASLAVAQHEGDETREEELPRLRPVLGNNDLPTIRRLGAMLAMAEALAEGRPRPQVAWKGPLLFVRLARGIPPSPRSFQRAKRFFKRAFGMEVRLGILR